jgi:hypothetical protein
MCFEVEKEEAIDYIDKFTSVTNRDQAVAQTVKYSFFLRLDLYLLTVGVEDYCCT